jgi:hypothetical protein
MQLVGLWNLILTGPADKIPGNRSIYSVTDKVWNSVTKIHTRSMLNLLVPASIERTDDIQVAQRGWQCSSVIFSLAKLAFIIFIRPSLAEVRSCIGKHSH